MATGTANPYGPTPDRGTWHPRPRVLQAMRKIDREAFLSGGDAGICIRRQRVADRGRPDDLAALHRRLHDRGGAAEPGDRVLEVGAGSGYAAAVMSRDRRRVFTIERHAPLAQPAASASDALGYDNVDAARRRRHAGLARGGAVRRHRRRRRRARGAGGAEAAARDRRPAGHAGGRGRRASRELLTRDTHRRGQLRGARTSAKSRSCR